jgi:copper oxidase (laccase) domain-containing protein
VYLHRSSLGPVDLAFTDRFGGVSAVPWAELNLALESDDDPAALAENHRRVLADFAPGDTLADLHQVHGSTVVVAGRDGFPSPPDADGVVTATPGITLMVRAADCVPVLLADPHARVVGAAHSGRPGLAAGVVPATVAAMRELGARAITAWGTPSLDIGAGVRAQLAEDGVTVVDVGPCTRESADLYSFRRDGAGAGRLAGLVRIAEVPR